MILIASVTVSGRGLYVDGQPFFVKGVGYQPIPVGYTKDYQWWLYPEIYLRDLALMKEMGVNTVRLWGSLPEEGEAFLDACEFYGIKVIMGYYPPDKGWSDATIRETRKQEFLSIVERWKDHPAILMWAVGNEHNYRVDDKAGWYSFVEECAKAALEMDPSHPVTTPNGDICDVQTYDSVVAHLSLWGANSYRGSSFGSLFSDFESYSSKPLLITEFGVDAVNNEQLDEDGQAYYDVLLWEEIESNSFEKGGVCVGGIVMEWVDEWWKAGLPSRHDFGGLTGNDPRDSYMNEEWWGIVDIDRNPRKVYYQLQNLWGKQKAVSFELGEPLVFPNPFDEELKVIFYTDQDFTLSAYLYNLFGKKIKTLAKEQTVYRGCYLRFNTQDVAKGVYFLVIVTSQKNYVRKVVKK